MGDYFKIEKYEFALLLMGIIAILAAVIPVILKRRNISAPIIYLVIGIAGYFICSKNTIKPLENLDIIKKVTEFVIIISLTNAGLKIKDPFKWHTWKYSVRLLVIAMPLTMVAAAYLGWWIVGLAPATAMLFGALIAPTDPVLASELQTSEPSKEDTSKIKLGLTSEAGINDGLAFPFTYLAILAATKGLDYKEWIGQWLLEDLLLKTAIGVVVGVLCGWLFCKVIISRNYKDETLSKIHRGIISISLTLVPYALAEIIGGYGFIAVFLAACLFSMHEKHEKHMDDLHDFNEEIESFIVAFLFIVTGVFIASNYDILLDIEIIAVAFLMVLVVRPLAGMLSFIKTDLNFFQKFVLSFYGIRGIGSIFYLAYALMAASFADAEKLLGITLATIFLSVFIHGISARSVQKMIKKYDSNLQNDK